MKEYLLECEPAEGDAVSWWDMIHLFFYSGLSFIPTAHVLDEIYKQAHSVSTTLNVDQLSAFDTFYGYLYFLIPLVCGVIIMYGINAANKGAYSP